MQKLQVPKGLKENECSLHDYGKELVARGLKNSFVRHLEDFGKWVLLQNAVHF